MKNIKKQLKDALMSLVEAIIVGGAIGGIIGYAFESTMIWSYSTALIVFCLFGIFIGADSDEY